jgi:P4 family phage/plasmid primase-like protien
MQTADDQRIADLLGFDKPDDRLPATVTFSRCLSETSARVKRHKLALPAFVTLLTEHEEGKKAGPSWLPATFTGERRSNESAETIQVAVLDLDGGQPFAEVAERIKAAGLAAIIHTTHSHTAERPKLRAVLFPSRPWHAKDYGSRSAARHAYRAGLLALADRLGLAVDRGATDPARLFFLPRHATGKEHKAAWIEGSKADVWTCAEAEEKGHAAVAERTAGESTPPEIVRGALAAVRNDSRFNDRLEWIKVLAAVCHALGEEGREAAEEWSASWSDGKHDPDAFDKAWRSIGNRPDDRAGAGTILFLARRDGWADPRREAHRERRLALFDDMPTVAEAMRSAERIAADQWTAGGDVANGARHANRLQGKRLYVSATGQWLAFTGQRWAAQTAEDTAADAKDTSAASLAEAARAVRNDPNDRNRALLGMAGKLHGSAVNLARMVEMARSEPGMSVASPAFFDRDPFTLTLPNGLLDLRTGAVRPARPEDRVYRLAGTAFDPEARAPRFERFLASVLPDPEIRAVAQRAVGYTLSGSVDEEVFFVAYGTGANGKSVFGNVIGALLGEYAGSFNATLVTKLRHENEAARMVARLPGLRLALVNETGVGDLWDSARMKELSSRERMSARLLHKETFDFMPTAKLWIRTNHLPGSLDAGDGFWRRCIPIPFTVQIPPQERTLDLDRAIIAEELPGVLNWALAGAMAWAREGLRVPAAIRGEVDSYREETDLLGMWLAERTEREPQARVPVGDAFRDYEAFCRSLNAHSGTAMTFSRAMTARGMKHDPSRKNGRRFMGFRLRELVSAGFTDDVESLV